ncbi:MAG: glucokinase [Deltaproteobacteria bacterium]|nr:glucokinase [Deltaproteobacteria bacterium]
MKKTIKKKTGVKRLILAGDIGGTKSLLGLFEVKDNGIKPIKKMRFRNKDFGGIEPLLAMFLKKSGCKGVKKAVLAVACPVEDNKGSLTNAGWDIDASLIKKMLGIKEALLINDLVAVGHSIARLGKKDIVVLQEGVKKAGNAAVIAAGTGLGEAILFWDGKKHIPFATEGGHADFAPRSPLESRLLTHLTNIYGHVSFERVVSGQGMCNIYDFLKSDRGAPEPEYLRGKFSSKDPAAVIADEALSGVDPDCADAMNIFLSAYGQEAGNLALKAWAVGGVYVGGGIAPKILSALKGGLSPVGGVFSRAFVKKGRFEKTLSNVPIYAIVNEDAALMGAAAFAAGL